MPSTYTLPDSYTPECRPIHFHVPINMLIQTDSLTYTRPYIDCLTHAPGYKYAVTDTLTNSLINAHTSTGTPTHKLQQVYKLTEAYSRAAHMHTRYRQRNENNKQTHVVMTNTTVTQTD